MKKTLFVHIFIKRQHIIHSNVFEVFILISHVSICCCSYST